MRVYGDIASGNCYKIKLLLSLLGQDHEWQHVDILAGESETPEFLAMNPNGKIPVLVLDDGETLSESNAILHYLAEGTEFLPDGRLQRARVLQWQFFEQYSHEPYIAVARFIHKYLGLPDDKRADYEARQAGGYKALRVMENQLEITPYLAGRHYTIADISLYAYTHVAREGGFDLTPFPAVCSWLGKVRSHPAHVTMEQFLPATTPV
ncbi:glutathione S-transferase family protein [Granulosicoccaceae sp. 1_MG-2023]|nr:glutathione S-transferase family protein [Granulosicoccaceae sp. 1_MG-2023]